MANPGSISTSAGLSASLLGVAVIADVLGGAGVATGLTSLALGALGTLSGGAAGSLAANAVQAAHADLEDRLRDPAQHLSTHDLQALTGRAMSVVIAAAIEDERLASSAKGRNYLKMLVGRIPKAWGDYDADVRYDDIAETSLPDLLARDTTESLNATLWKDLIGTLGNKEVSPEEDRALGVAAELLHERFSVALIALLKANAAEDGAAFAGVVLSLLRDTAAGIKQIANADAKLSDKVVAELKAINAKLRQGAETVAATRDDVEAEVAPVLKEIRELTSELAGALGLVLTSLSDLHDTAADIRADAAATRADAAETKQLMVAAIEGNAPRKPVTDDVPTISKTFVPRHNVTKMIHEALEDRVGEVIVRQAVASAHGGYGKTVAAILYANEYAQHYPGGRFLLSLESKDITQELVRVLKKLGGTPTEDAEADALEARDRLAMRPSLLILDNITTKEAWAEMVDSGLVPTGECRVLITTRDSTLAPRNPSGRVTIDRLTKQEGRQVLAGFCEKRDSPSDATADAITEWLGGLAVAIAAVGASLSLLTDTSWDDYWTNLKTLSVDQLPDAQPEVRVRLGTERPLEEHRRTLHVIDDAIKTLPPAERRAVEYAALLDPDLAPRAWLHWLLKHDAERADDLRIELPKPAPDHPNPDPASDVLKRLERLDVLLPGGEEGKLLNLHRLWHARMNERMSRSVARLQTILRCASSEFDRVVDHFDEEIVRKIELGLTRIGRVVESVETVERAVIRGQIFGT